MSDLDGIPEERFSHDAALMINKSVSKYQEETINMTLTGQKHND